jgi:methylthioribose-1-phosphate isomerase
VAAADAVTMATRPTVVDWSPDGRGVRILDQRQLPARTTYLTLATLADAIEAIRALAVRGAPAIGVAAAMALAVEARQLAAQHPQRDAFDRALAAAAAALRAARPTAVNLPWAVASMLATARATPGESDAVAEALVARASALRDDDRAMCDRIGAHGLAMVPDGARVLTHCNAGALATAGSGTALAPVYAAVAAGRVVSVLAAETRPVWQGARLTAWELQHAGIPVTVCTDSMVATLMRHRRVDLVLVGADRICANGDVVNKIGTYAVAVAAAAHQVPVIACAPWSTVDPHTPHGDAVEIETRGRDEVARPGGVLVVPDGVPVENPAFDVTPASLVHAIVTDRGVHRAPFHFT